MALTAANSFNQTGFNYRPNLHAATPNLHISIIFDIRLNIIITAIASLHDEQIIYEAV